MALDKKYLKGNAAWMHLIAHARENPAGVYEAWENYLLSRLRTEKNEAYKQTLQQELDESRASWRKGGLSQGALEELGLKQQMYQEKLGEASVGEALRFYKEELGDERYGFIINKKVQSALKRISGKRIMLLDPKKNRKEIAIINQLQEAYIEGVVGSEMIARQHERQILMGVKHNLETLAAAA